MNRRHPSDLRSSGLVGLAVALAAVLIVVVVATGRDHNPPSSRTVPSTVTTLGVKP